MELLKVKIPNDLQLSLFLSLLLLLLLSSKNSRPPLPHPHISRVLRLALWAHALARGCQR